jgi:Gram-negative bacterial TonB protein C-terminal
METHRDFPKTTSERIPPDPLGTFTRAIFVEVWGDPRRRAVDCAVSVAVHGAVVAMLIIVPLVFLSDLHPYSFTEAAMITTVPPPLGQLPSAPVLPRSIPKKIIPTMKLTKPVWHFNARHAPPPDPPPSPDVSSAGATGGIETPLFPNLAHAPVLVAPALAQDTETFRIGGDFKVPHVVYGVSLDYPEVARKFGLVGKVILKAIVDERGNVDRVRKVSGPELLAEAAAKAVSMEKFAPGTLNGEPTTCELIVEVTFKLF